MQRFMLAAVVAFALVAFAYGETDCQSHQRNSRNSAHSLSWNIQCDENGDYLPLQCTNDTEKNKWCACYNKEEAITQPSKKTRICTCPLKKDEDRKNNVAECDLPRCANTGKYEKKQCGCNGKCNCVNPDNGERTTQPERNQDLQCP